MEGKSMATPITVQKRRFCVKLQGKSRFLFCETQDQNNWNYWIWISMILLAFASKIDRSRKHYGHIGFETNLYRTRKWELWWCTEFRCGREVSKSHGIADCRHPRHITPFAPCRFWLDARLCITFSQMFEMPPPGQPCVPGSGSKWFKTMHFSLYIGNEMKMW